MKKLIALMLVASFTGAVIAQQPVPQNAPPARAAHDSHREKDKKDRHHHRSHKEHHEHKATDKK